MALIPANGGGGDSGSFVPASNYTDLTSVAMTAANPYIIEKDGYLMAFNNASSSQILYIGTAGTFASIAASTSQLIYVKKGTPIWKGSPAPAVLRIIYEA